MREKLKSFADLYQSPLDFIGKKYQEAIKWHKMPEVQNMTDRTFRDLFILRSNANFKISKENHEDLDEAEKA
jgi:hypothetical protein